MFSLFNALAGSGPCLTRESPAIEKSPPIFTSLRSDVEEMSFLSFAAFGFFFIRFDVIESINLSPERPFSFSRPLLLQGSL